MEQLDFKFDEADFNKLFPFYILIDATLKIKGIGKSLLKTCPNIKLNQSFPEKFIVKRPFTEVLTFENLNNVVNQLVVVETTTTAVQLRGQFQRYCDSILFVGTPWFVSMEEVGRSNLNLHDFAYHDPLLDLLHVLKMQEITNKELNEVLMKINQQKKALKKDQEELNQLSLVASANENGVFFINNDGTIIWCNDSYLHLTGRSNTEVIGKSPFQVGVCEETRKADLRKVMSSFFRGEMFEAELIHGRKNSANFWAKIKAQPIFDTSGKVTQFFAVIEDITEKKTADFRLIESENRLSFLIKNSQTGVVVVDDKNQVVLTNKKFCNMFAVGEDPDLLKGMDSTSSIVDIQRFFKDPDQYEQRVKEILERNEPVFNEELELADGRVFQRSYVPIISDGVYSGNLRSYVDITIKKKYEESLQKEKEKYGNIIANMNLGLIEVDNQDKITLANQSFSEISGYTQDELIGTKVANLFRSAENGEVVDTKMKLRANGVSDSYEIQIINKNKEKKYWHISAAPNFDISGNIIGSIGIHLDITQQKEQEEQLYLLSLIAEKNINSVVVCDKEGKIEWVNASFESMSGYSKEKIVGIKPGNLLQGPNSKPETIAYLRGQIKRGQPFNCEILNYSKTGEEYWVHVQGQALYNKKNEVIRYFAIQENISEKKLLENQKEQLVENLAKTNKELEDYAQIVSHDLKSPLRSIHSLISWIKEDNDKAFSEQTSSYFSMIENKVEKMDHLIDGILTYSKIDKEDGIKEQVNTDQLMQSIISIIHLPKHISISVKNDLPTLYSNRYRLQQLFQNIIVNAVNYIEKEIGLIEIGSEEFEDYVVFSIQDNGQGIAKEHLKKVFNTFQSFTTNADSTGLGLAIVKKIVDAYQGEIWIESELEKGSTFFIKLKK